MPRGLVIGGFRIPTVGHEYLMNFASNWCGGKVDIVVCSRPGDLVHGRIRQGWLQEVMGNRASVLNFYNELPEDDNGSQDFWNLWAKSLVDQIGYTPDFLFASELYGKPLADAIGATFIPVDIDRDTVPVSSTKVRKDVYTNWDGLLAPVRAYYLKRVAILGAESCGKTTLARKLALAHNTVMVPEWARTYLENTNPEKYPDATDIEHIAHGQAAAEDSLLHRARHVLISDTDHVCTAVWCRQGLGYVPDVVEKYINERKYDLRIVLKDNVAFKSDILRYGGDKREMTFESFIKELSDRKLPYVVVDKTNWNARYEQALDYINDMLRNDG